MLARSTVATISQQTQISNLCCLPKTDTVFYVEDIATKKNKNLNLKVVKVKGDEVFKVPGLKINVSSYLKKKCK